MTAGELEAIKYFSLLWTLFEERALDNNASTKKIIELVKKWDGDGVLKISDFADSLDYFRNRYSAEGSLTHHFAGLRLRPRDRPELGDVDKIIDA